MADLSGLTVRGLLALHADTIEALRERGAVRSTNNPTGDYAEYLFCRAFGWRQAGNSERDMDAVGKDGTRYQIKGRRLTRHSRVRQLGALRDLNDGHFDYLAAVLFEEDFSVLRAALVPHRLVLERSGYVERTNSWRFLLRDEVWGWDGVRDVTAELRVAEESV
jgi:hypothetical protein